MTEFAADIPDYPLKAARREQILLAFTFAITGGAGAVGAIDVDDSAVTITKGGGTGQYIVTFPKSRNCKPSIQLESPAKTVSHADITVAPDAAAGTMTFVTGNATGTATNPAAGDKVHIMLVLRKRDDI